MPSKIKFNHASLWLFAFCVMLLSCSDQQHKDNALLVDSIINKTSWVYDDSFDKEAVVNKLRKILHTDQRLPSQARYKAYHSLYFYYFYKTEYEQALLYADSMLYVVEGTKKAENYIEELANAYYFKGDALFRLKAYEEAYRNYFLGKKLMPEIRDKCTSSNYNYRIAMILYKQSKFADAGKYFKETLTEVRQCSTSFSEVFRQQELLNNIALCYSRSDRLDSALYYYDKALQYIEENDTIPEKKKYYLAARGVIYGNMGGEMLRKKQYEQAEKLLKQSIRINDQPGLDSVDAVTAKIKLIKVYLATKHTPEAGRYLDTLAKDNRTIKILSYIQSYHHLYAQYLNAIGEGKKAYAHLQRYTDLSDSLQKETNKINATNIDERFRNLSNESEINHLKREAEIQQRYLYITSVFIAMALLIVLLIYSYWRRSRRNVAKLTELNDQISSQKNKLEEAFSKLGVSDKEKDTILRAVAHDLRNPVVGISSLTKLMILEDEEGINTDKLSLIDGACNNALTLIDDIIEAAENKQDVDFNGKKTHAELTEIIKNAIALLSYRADEKQQLIHFETNIGRLELSI